MQRVEDSWIPMHDYKSLRAAVMMCAALVNTQTDILLAQPAKPKMRNKK